MSKKAEKQPRPHALRRKAAHDFLRKWEVEGFPDYFESGGFRITTVPKPAEGESDCWEDPRNFDRQI